MTAPLLLFPTALERTRFLEVSRAAVQGLETALVGFGPVAAAARTAALCARPEPPTALLLCGIAGRYPDGPPVGEATEFGHVSMDGVGALRGPDLLTPADLRIPQWQGEDGVFIEDALGLGGRGPGLLTVCAAAGSRGDVDARLRRTPEAAAEDMEGFAVALAARLAHVPVRIVRGISNEAGDRDHARWRIDDALASASVVVERILD